MKLLVDRLSPNDKDEFDYRVALACIEALNVWTQFARSYYLSCAFEAKRTSGGRVKWEIHGIDHVTGALQFAASWKNGGKQVKGAITWRNEPTWSKPKTLLGLFSQGRASNLPQVQKAFAFTTPVFDTLPTVRNFFAHRAKNTLDKVHSDVTTFSLPRHSHPTKIMLDAFPGRPQNILCDWIDDLRITIDLLCE